MVAKQYSAVEILSGNHTVAVLHHISGDDSEEFPASNVQTEQTPDVPICRGMCIPVNSSSTSMFPLEPVLVSENLFLVSVSFRVSRLLEAVLFT